MGIALAKAMCVDREDSEGGDQQVIVPRKGVLELQRLLSRDGEVTLRFGPNHLQADSRRRSLHFEAD
jgi:DNA polymerase III sliding clamp (beta) subunit (PCNA family)